MCACCADLQKGVALASPSIVPSADLQKGVACPSIVSAEFANGEREIGTRRFPKPMGVCPSVFDTVGCFRCKLVATPSAFTDTLHAKSKTTQGVGCSMHVRNAVQMC